MKRIQMLSAATGLLFVATVAQAQHGQDDRRGHQDQSGPVSPLVQARTNPGNPGNSGRAEEAQRRDVEQARAGQARAQEMENQRRTAQSAEQQRDFQARQRDVEAHQRDVDTRQRDIEARERDFQARQREEAAQIERAQQLQERNRLIQAEQRAQTIRAYDRARDYRPGYDYRYNMAGVYRETNLAGVDVLRQAINSGYEQGYRAGQMDVRDRVAPDYRRAFDYQNGTFGYTSNYVPESDYTYYFREGFQRGYDDAYGNRLRYGTFSNGSASILGDIAAGILGLTSIR